MLTMMALHVPFVGIPVTLHKKLVECRAHHNAGDDAPLDLSPVPGQGLCFSQ